MAKFSFNDLLNNDIVTELDKHDRSTVHSQYCVEMDNIEKVFEVDNMFIDEDGVNPMTGTENWFGSVPIDDKVFDVYVVTKTKVKQMKFSNFSK